MGESKQTFSLGVATAKNCSINLKLTREGSCTRASRSAVLSAVKVANGGQKGLKILV